jgi:hypothetical protein
MNRVPSGNRGSGTTLQAEGIREELIRRVETSRTFEKSPRLRAFLSYVCQCALNEQPESATEQQIGIHVFNRVPGYNPSEDNVVRSQARLLRWKLEQYFADEGKDETLIITIPKGQYFPVFQERLDARDSEAGSPRLSLAERSKRLPTHVLILVALIAALTAAAVWLAFPLIHIKQAKHTDTTSANGSSAIPNSSPTPLGSGLPHPIAIADDGGIRIAAGYSGPSFIDVWGRRWDADRNYEGGAPRPGPHDLYPPVADPRLFRTMREAQKLPGEGSPADTLIAYNIPARPGEYELRLYFADPDLVRNANGQEDSQNTRHFSISLNGQNLLWDFDPVADGGGGAVDIRAFKDVSPDKDGMVHLQFIPGQGLPFVNAIELTPGTRGKIKPIRICAQSADVVDGDSTRWSADNYFIHGRTIVHPPDPDASPDSQQIPPFAVGERYGNFSYAIPVPPGSYTVKLYFAESFFLSGVTPGMCTGGVGCRVFDVTCNGVMLLRDFDVYKNAGGAGKTVVRVFHGLHPNGQGKLLLDFSPTVNYAEVRAIEVLDEAK